MTRLTNKDIKGLSPAIQKQIKEKLTAQGALSKQQKENKKKLKKESSLESAFAKLLWMYGLPNYKTQYKFHPDRKWLFDFAWIDKQVAVEIDGETSHARYHQTRKDAEKRNAAKLAGWMVLVFTGEMIKQDPDGCIDQLKKALGI